MAAAAIFHGENAEKKYDLWFFQQTLMEGVDFLS